MGCSSTQNTSGSADSVETPTTQPTPTDTTMTDTTATDTNSTDSMQENKSYETNCSKYYATNGSDDIGMQYITVPGRYRRFRISC